MPIIKNTPNQANDTLQYLKDVAFRTLLLHPGCDYCDWEKFLVEEYASLLIDVYGSNPFETFEKMTQLWETPYFDPESRLEYTFCQWANAFATHMSVQMYHDLTPSCRQ